MTRTLAILAAACGAAAQTPVVGDINLYGLRRVAPERVLAAAGVKAGAPLPPSKGDMEDSIAKVPGVVLAAVQAVCCEGPRVMVFIGVEEKGAPHAAFRSEPAGNAGLPEDIVDAYHEFLAAVGRAAGRANAAEDLTAGHSMMADPAARAFQVKFLEFAQAELPLLREVLRTAAEPEQRAVAAAIIDYAPRKQDIVDDLQYALQDPDETVRANAVRSLRAVAVLAARQPQLGITISPTWLIQLLNSVVLSDRVEAVNALLTLTDHENAPVLEPVREHSMGALEDMARWQTAGYALPPFVLLGRAAGLADDRIQQEWKTGDRDAAVRKMIAAAARGKKG